MNTRIIKKFESKLLVLIGDIIFNELDDSVSMITTVNEVVVTKDKQNAKIYISFLNGDNDTNLKRLKKRTSIIRNFLSKELTSRRCPNIEFIIYEKLEHINYIEKLLEK